MPSAAISPALKLAIRNNDIEMGDLLRKAGAR
jgi:hypothetical protein